MGQVLSVLEDFDGLLFIGSVNIGYQLCCQFFGQLEKIFVFEMGGNNLLIIDEVVDIDVVVYLIIQLVFVIVG